MLQCYQSGGCGIGGLGRQLWGKVQDQGFTIGANIRTVKKRGGGVVIDWDLKTSLEGLFAAGDVIFGAGGHSTAATTGKYAGRKAAEFANKVAEPKITREQVHSEKARVYAPIQRSDGIGWKELNNSICKVMQNYCGDSKNEELLNIGLMFIYDLKEVAASSICAMDPHKLGRTIEVFDILTTAEMILHASLARKASSKFLGFKRWDYPEMDPQDWHMFITIKLENGEVKVDKLSVDFWSKGPVNKSYEAHCGL